MSISKNQIKHNIHITSIAMRRLLSVIFMLWLAQTILFAATGMFTCKGTVVDGEGEPIIGDSIVITGSNAVGTNK